MKTVLLITLLIQTIYANMYHLKLLSDKVPDLSNIEAFGHDIGDKWQTNNEKAIILSYWIDQLTTYEEPLYYSRQWDDPIAFINNNEYGMCSDMTLLMNAMGEGAFGFTGRHHELNELNQPIEHTVPEIEYDGKLHLFDPSFGFAYGHYDNGIVTSMEDYALNPYFSRHNTPTALTRDSDGDGPIKAWLSADNFGWSIDRFRYDEYSPEQTWIENRTEGYYGVHRFDISIEDYEFYTRYWSHLDGLDGFNRTDFFWPRYNYNDINDYSWHDDDFQQGEHRGNGLWVYEPDLSDKTSYESSSKIKTEDGIIYPTLHADEGIIVFKIDTANFVTGVLLEAEIKRAASVDSVIIEASSSGGAYWFPIWHNESVGDSISIKKNISNMIKGTLQSQDIRHVTDFLVRVRLYKESGDKSSALRSLKVSTVTMLGKSSLPKLKLGSNEITIDKANNHSQYQTKTLDPVLTRLENGTNDQIHWENIEAWKLYAKDYKNMSALENFGNMYTVIGKSSWKKGWITYELDAPRDIKKARIGGSFIVKNDPHEKFIIKYRIYNGEWSSWREISTYDWNSRNVYDKRENQSHNEEWYIAEQNVRKVQFKIEAYGENTDIEALHMEIDYEAKQAPSKPLYVTYSWSEYYEDEEGHLPETADGGITRTYREKITSLPHKFTINTGGVIQPRMNWISMNLEGYEDPNNHAPLGYSDGIDKGNSDFIPLIRYDIGDIISINKPISLTVAPSYGKKEQLVDGRIIAASDGERGNQGGGKVEVQNDADDIVKFDPGFGTLEAVIDLGSVQNVGGVRIDSYKDHWDAYFPESISVEISTDKDHFKAIAHDRYKSAKYAHNLWPVQWSLPLNANSRYSGRFPNYGLLSNYTFIPFDSVKEARYIKIRVKEQNYYGEAKGFTLSEIHIYDKLIANQWSAKLKHAKDMVVINPTISTVDIEAESGIITSPMYIGDDSNAFDTKYITNDNGNGYVSYKFNVKSTGRYKIWARAIAPDGVSDSFFVKMDNDSEDIWDISNSTSWKWTKINGRSINNSERTFYLTSGEHTLTIRGREGGVKLDKIVVTNDDNYITPQDPEPVEQIISTIEIEAESTLLTAPMVIRDDSNAFNTKYITNDNGSGKATYTFDIQNSGTYKIWARAIAPDGVSDSFFVKMDNDSEDIWDISNSTSWKWTKINGRSDHMVRRFNLVKGKHTLVIRAREGGAKLDKIVITNDNNYIPKNPQLAEEILSIEAENSTLYEPMITRDDTQASNGKYITNDYGEGSAIFNFNIINAGVYKLQARYIAPNGTSDSFFVKMDNDSEDIWDMHNSNNWRDGFIRGRALGSDFLYNLTEGAHSFILRAREGGAKVDKLTLIKQ